MTFYLLDTVKSPNGAILEYRIAETKKDMRKKFCKQNIDCEKSPLLVIKAIGETGAKIKGDRIILKDAQAAYKFNQIINS